MRTAEASPYPLLLSDWSHLTSDEYVAAEKATGYDLLSVTAKCDKFHL